MSECDPKTHTWRSVNGVRTWYDLSGTQVTDAGIIATLEAALVSGVTPCPIQLSDVAVSCGSAVATGVTYANTDNTTELDVSVSGAGDFIKIGLGGGAPASDEAEAQALADYIASCLAAGNAVDVTWETIPTQVGAPVGIGSGTITAQSGAFPNFNGPGTFTWDNGNTPGDPGQVGKLAKMTATCETGDSTTGLLTKLCNTAEIVDPIVAAINAKASTHLIEGCIIQAGVAVEAFTIINDTGTALFAPKPLSELGFVDCCAGTVVKTYQAQFKSSGIQNITADCGVWSGNFDFASPLQPPQSSADAGSQMQQAKISIDAWLAANGGGTVKLEYLSDSILTVTITGSTCTPQTASDDSNPGPHAFVVV